MHSARPEPVEIDPRDSELLEEIGRLRVSAWKNFFPKIAERTDCWLDDYDRMARHWVVFEGETIVGAARLSMHQRFSELPEADLYSELELPRHNIPIFC